MELAAAAIVLVYGMAGLIIAVFVLAQVHLLVGTLGAKRPPTPGLTEELPRVTVQLPLYNERLVVGELVDAVAALDWPRDRLQIQILDDSTDETTAIATQRCLRLAEQGLDISVVRRPDRAGFKAGALAHGLTLATGELVAVFDADFRPRPDFLRQVIAEFSPGVGLVQARWSHPHAMASWITRLQALQLDHHFTLEQRGRDAGGLLMSFNGTAGVWRRQCIEEAGGWRADSLTEDLDLSYRAQLAGWRLRYVDALDAPAELPQVMGAVRTQQFRWMKGGAQVARLMLARLWRSEQPLRRKIQGSSHLLGSTVFLAVFSISLVGPLLVPLASWGPAWAGPAMHLTGSILRLVLVLLCLTYGATCVRRAGSWREGVRRFVVEFPLLLGVSAGMALHNSIAVVEGWGGRESPFVRTPKVGAGEGPLYALPPAPPLVWAELAISLWLGAGAVVAGTQGSWMAVIFLANQAGGYAAFAGVTVHESSPTLTPSAAS